MAGQGMTDSSSTFVFSLTVQTQQPQTHRHRTSHYRQLQPNTPGYPHSSFLSPLCVPGIYCVTSPLLRRVFLSPVAV